MNTGKFTTCAVCKKTVRILWETTAAVCVEQHECLTHSIYPMQPITAAISTTVLPINTFPTSTVPVVYGTAATTFPIIGPTSYDAKWQNP